MKAAHIPHGAIEKTDYIKSLGYKGEMKFFVFDGKTYCNKPQFSINGKDWFEFCDEITAAKVLDYTNE